MSVIMELDNGYPNPLIPEVAATVWIVFIHKGNPPSAKAETGNKINNPAKIYFFIIKKPLF